MFPQKFTLSQPQDAPPLPPSLSRSLPYSLLSFLPSSGSPLLLPSVPLPQSPFLSPFYPHLVLVQENHYRSRGNCPVALRTRGGASGRVCALLSGGGPFTPHFPNSYRRVISAQALSSQKHFPTVAWGQLMSYCLSFYFLFRSFSRQLIILHIAPELCQATFPPVPFFLSLCFFF